MTARDRLIGDRYRLGELLGTGGSASVFAARDEASGEDVALKVLHPHLSTRPAARDAFLAEAARAQRLLHPNIVGVRGVGVEDRGDDPVAWIAMDRAQGVTLAELVAARGALSAEEATPMLEVVLRALEHAHESGLVHRDVSPANIMLDTDARGCIAPSSIRLLDFGLADAAGAAVVGTDDLLNMHATGRAGVLGNVGYMSPEHVRGEAVDARGDIYQAGAVLYFALTGRAPFVRETIDLTMRAHLAAPPPVPSVTDRRIPRDLDRIVVRALLKNPEDRFATASDMRRALTERHNAPVENAGAAAATATIPPPAAPSRAEVTRVLATAPPIRRTDGGGSSALTAAAPTAAPRGRSRAALWFGATASALIVATIVAVAVTGTPTASGGAPPQAVSSPEPAASAPTVIAASPAEPIPPQDLRREVPDLMRQSLAEAEQALRTEGFAVGEIRRVESALPAETVLETSPVAGTLIDPGAAVVLVVASGSHTIPDVAGQGRDAAAALLQAAGFAPSFAYRDAPSETLPGTILGTSPSAGTLHAIGTVITVFEAVPRTPTASPSPTPDAPTPTTTPTPGAAGRAGAAP